MTHPQALLADRAWRIRESAWLLVPFMTAGFFTVFMLLRIAWRTGDAQLKKVALALCAPTALMWIALGASSDYDEPDNAWDGIGSVLMFVLWIGGSIFCATYVNRRYLTWKAHRGAQPAWYEQAVPMQPTASWTSGAGAPGTVLPGAVNNDPFGLRQAQSQYLASGPSSPPSTPSVAPAPPAAPPAWAPAPAPAAAAAAPADLNRLSEQQLQSLEGLGPILAKRIVAERDRCGGFHSVDDLAQVGVPPHVLVRLRQQLVAAPLPARAHSQTPRGRVLDI